MEKKVNFQMEEMIPEWLSDYPEDKFTAFKSCFLSTAMNSHNLGISEEVLRRDAKTILGNFLVAKLQLGDATTHLPSEIIYGYFPKEQEIEFEETDDGIVKAWAYCVISKQYAKEFNDIFDKENYRNTSVEMTVELPEGQDEGDVISFDIYGLTCLGLKVKGSCPDAMMTMIRFSEQDADSYFAKIHKDRLTDLEKFAKENNKMAEAKSYKIDKSKEAISDADWSDVDKVAMRDKIMAASNRDKLVKAVYALVEDGWEDAPSEHLKYPLMELKGDTFVYNRNALASALGYAKKENEITVVSKIEKIYKDLGLDEKEGKEETKMEIEFAAVDIGDLWGRLWHEIDETRHWEYGIVGIYEEDNQKFAILYDRAKKLYRLDFSLTEDGMTVAEDVIEVKQEFVVTDNIKRFAEPENVADYRFAEPEKKDDEPEDKGEDKDDKEDDEHIEMSVDECMEKIAKLEADIEERDHIIMDKDVELEELRAFKKGIEDKEKAMSIEAVLAEIKGCVDDTKMAELRSDGMTYEFANLDVWSNKVKAMAFEVTKSTDEHKEVMFRCAAPVTEQKKSANVWERIKNNI